MNYELFLNPVAGPRTAASVDAALKSMCHLRSLGRWASYANPTTGVSWTCDWSDAHFCCSLPTGRAHFFGVEFARVIGRLCRDDGWIPAGIEPRASAPEHILARWDAHNLTTLRAQGDRLSQRAVAPREVLLEYWASHFFGDVSPPALPNWSGLLDREVVETLIRERNDIPPKPSEAERGRRSPAAA